MSLAPLDSESISMTKYSRPCDTLVTVHARFRAIALMPYRPPVTRTRGDRRRFPSSPPCAGFSICGV